jgi:hypothetical protein
MITRRGLFGILAGAVVAVFARPALASHDLNPIPLARLPGTSPFWGPKMREAIGIAKLLGVRTEGVPPFIFAAEVDELTGQRHPPRSTPEEAAAIWLPHLRRIVRSRGLVK